MTAPRILFIGTILVVTALYFLNPGPDKFEDFLRKEGGDYASQQAGAAGEAVAGATGRDVASWLAERVGREVAGQASQAFEHENYHVASLYHVDFNGRAPGGEWEFLGIANVFFPITTPEIQVLAPVVLEGTSVRLEPLRPDHLGALCAVGLDSEIWRWSPQPVATRDGMAAYIEAALAAQERGEALPFATVDRATDTVVGSTRFGNVALEHRRVEIGWTWLAPPWQRTAINTETKRLMLAHAFETQGCVRVELKTDALNARSRAAMLRLGATEEGTLRQHMVTASGRLRDTVYLSILDHEWPDVRDRLDARLARGA